MIHVLIAIYNQWNVERRSPMSGWSVDKSTGDIKYNGPKGNKITVYALHKYLQDEIKNERI